MAFTNPPEAVIKAILSRPLTIAVVICSDDPTRDSYRIAGRLKEFGFRMIPVNPFATGKQLHGERCYASLAEVPEHVDLVDVFRRPTLVDSIVDEAIACGVEIFWMQLGVINETAARRAQEAGLTVVMDRCTSRDYRRLFLLPVAPPAGSGQG
jgi:predicted CoA-binding protein